MGVGDQGRPVGLPAPTSLPGKALADGLGTHQGPLGLRQELAELGEQVLLAAEEAGHLSEHLLLGHATRRPPLRAQLFLLQFQERGLL